jgi:hypothetical protein
VEWYSLINLKLVPCPAAGQFYCPLFVETELEMEMFGYGTGYNCLEANNNNWNETEIAARTSRRISIVIYPTFRQLKHHKTKQNIHNGENCSFKKEGW